MYAIFIVSDLYLLLTSTHLAIMILGKPTKQQDQKLPLVDDDGNGTCVMECERITT